jgi:hypothetical protein
MVFLPIQTSLLKLIIRIKFQFKISQVLVGVLDRQTYQGGTRGSRLCGEDRHRETENSKVRARHETQDLYRFGSPRWRALRPVWGIKYGALRLVLGWLRSVARLGTRPSFI